MKPQQIVKTLKTVFGKYFDTIDPELKELITKYGYVTGGAIPCMINGDYVNDYDVYFSNKETADHVLAYYQGLILRRPDAIETDLGLGFKSYTYTEEYENTYLPKFISPNAVTLYSKPTIQLMVGFYGQPKKVTDAFDWLHIKSYFCFEDMKLRMLPRTYELLLDKNLIYTGSDYPLSSLLRTRKYMKRGWSISAHEMAKIALEMQKHDLTNKEQLIAQMSGIDPLYIAEQLQNLSSNALSIDERINELEGLINEEDTWTLI